LTIAVLAKAVLSQLVEPEITSVSPLMFPQGVPSTITITGNEFGKAPYVAVGRRECFRVVLVKPGVIQCSVPAGPRSGSVFRSGVVVTVDGLDSNEVDITFQPTSPELSVNMVLPPGATPTGSEELQEQIANELDVESRDQIVITDLTRIDGETFKVSFVVLSSSDQPTAHSLAEERVQRHAGAKTSTNSKLRGWSRSASKTQAIFSFKNDIGVEVFVVSACVAAFLVVLISIAFTWRQGKATAAAEKKARMRNIEGYKYAADDTVMV